MGTVEDQELRRNGNISSRRNGLGISRSSFNRIVRQDIWFHAYVLVKRQELRPNDPAQRLAFCNWFEAEYNNNPNFLSNLETSDETVFSLNSEVDTRNVVKYSLYGNGHPNDHYLEHRQGAARLMV